MRIFGQSFDGSPNDKQYELRYEDGDRYRYDHGGKTQKTFDLAAAMSLADHEAGMGVQLYVVDPDTDTVLWVGQRAMR